jgi:hypothetical protein
VGEKSGQKMKTVNRRVARACESKWEGLIGWKKKSERKKQDTIESPACQNHRGFDLAETKGVERILSVSRPAGLDQEESKRI